MNIWVKSDTFEVSNLDKSNDSNKLQYSNILAIVVAELVWKLGSFKFSNLLQYTNIESKDLEFSGIKLDKSKLVKPLQ